MPMERAPLRGAPPAGLGSLGQVGRGGTPFGVHRRAERGEDSVGRVERPACPISQGRTARETPPPLPRPRQWVCRAVVIGVVISLQRLIYAIFVS